jgi:hypothetical protein
MVFPFMAQVLGHIPGWFLFPLWYAAIGSWAIAALWRRMQPLRAYARTCARVHRKTAAPSPYAYDGGMTWLVRR